MRKILTILFLTALLPFTGRSQHYLGLATSNWSATNSVYLNPANIADSRTKFSIDLFSVNFGFDNSLAKFNISKATKFAQNSDGKLGDLLEFNDKQYFSMTLPTAEIRLPGFMVSINHKHSIALTTRVRVFDQFDHFSQPLFRTLVDSTLSTTSPASFQADKFNWTAHLFSEIGLSYGGVVYEKGKHQVKVGITGRYLMGIGYKSIVGKSLDGTYSTPAGGDAQLAIGNTDLHYAKAGLDFGGNGDNNIASNFGTNNGTGFGGDIGVTYEFRPKYQRYQYDMDGKTGLMDNSKNKYLLRFSAAITDLGSIKYTKNSTLNFTHSGSTPAILNGSEVFDKIGNYDSIRTYLASKGVNADSGTGTQSVKVYMPKALRIGIDYHAVKGLYINAMILANMADRTKIGNSYYSQVTITPRWDSRVFTLAVPITYATMNSSLKVGAAVRLGGFFIGSDDMMGLIGKSAYGANFYFGAYVPFAKRRVKDSDGDGVSNRKDKCPGEKGTWEMRGCPNPDKDGDGILDKDDKCPDVAGSKTAMGCPDADLDSVADAEDRCPQEAGPRALRGCPDRDHDGIADIDDACPDQAGLAQFKGCPDTDGDGVPDNEDACPTLAGPVANQGCPDSDNDGIPDNKDKCPTVAGTIANHGCPEVSVEVKKRLAFAATALQFDLGKASIKKASYPMLDGIVKILNDYPDYMMTIEGHTDNVGNPAKNMQLSKERANAVKNYFVSKGIAADRLAADGFGDTKPVMSNKTAAGRSKNRRVAMDLKLK